MNEKIIPKGIQNTSNRLETAYDCVFLKFIDQKSDKFWCAFPDGDNYLIVWGKNDKNPYQSQIIDKESAKIRLNEKINKGYKVIKNNILLYNFQNNPQWFFKLQTSAHFKSALLAYQLNEKLEDKSKSPNGKPLKI